MARTLRIMTWNVQNYGETKSGLKFNNFDITSAIARLVVSELIDIFCLVEINTTKEDDAYALCVLMRSQLRFWSAHAGAGPAIFNDCLMSPNTKREFYAFFVRDSAICEPLKITKPVGSDGKVVTTVGATAAWNTVEFASAAGGAVVLGAAPLLSPDMMYAHYVAKWPDTMRLPCVGLFRIAGASAGNELLPIVVCHFDPNAAQAQHQFRILQYFSLLASLRPNAPANMTIGVKGAGGVAQLPVNLYLLTGDFNVDYLKSEVEYADLTGSDGGALGSDALNFNDSTMLVAFNVFYDHRRDYKTTKSLQVALFDNFFFRSNPNAATRATFQEATSIDVPGRVMARTITLNASVKYYSELQKRGLDNTPYEILCKDFVNQLTGDVSTNITVEGAFVGGRIISDHLPVFIEGTL